MFLSILTIQEQLRQLQHDYNAASDDLRGSQDKLNVSPEKKRGFFSRMFKKSSSAPPKSPNKTEDRVDGAESEQV